MRIDESCINHNAVRLIQAVMERKAPVQEQDKESLDKYRFAMLSTIDGILIMAEAMKEALKA